jgi:hypothetical protein
MQLRMRYQPTVTTSLAWGITSGYTDKYRCHGQMVMELAPRMKPRAQNVPGNLFVDEGTMMIRLVFEVPVRIYDYIIISFYCNGQVALTVTCVDGCVHLHSVEKVSKVR